MGYRTEQTLIYGIAVSEAVARQIYQDYLCHQEAFFSNQPIYRRQHEHLLQRFPQQYPITPYEQHGRLGANELFYGDLWANETDARIHDTTFEPGCEHFLGIYVAQSPDDIVYFIRNTPPEAITNFHQLIVPVMQQYGFSQDPQTIIISQVK